MSSLAPPHSARRDELLERCYGYVLAQGVGGLSLRPLAAAVGSSPRVLLFLFGSKDGLLRALFARARQDELDLLAGLRGRERELSLAGVVAILWQWLSNPRHRPLLRLWSEAYTQSLTQPSGPWAGFGRATVDDWLALLADAQPAGIRARDIGLAERTLALAVLRGSLLDLLATGDHERTSAAVQRYLATLPPGV